jgi:hypothetical protein
MAFAILLEGFISTESIAQKSNRQVEKNGMLIEWHHQNDSVRFEMSAPTQGWIAIGFNDREGMRGTYLLMGRVRNKQAEVVEHYTQNPGNYRPITDLGGQSLVHGVNGKESDHKTVVRFSVPTKAQTAYRSDFFPGKKYFLTLAFSREDDFQHHSIMRTSVKITL